MPTNRFERPNSTVPISRFVPLPFEEIHRALKTRQDDYDQQIAIQDQAKGSALNLDSIQEHEDYKTAYVDRVNGAFEELQNKNLDPSRMEYQKEQMNIIRKLAGDPNLQRMKHSLINKKEYDANVEKLKENGKYASYNDPYKLNPFVGIDQDGNVNEFQRKSVYSSEDHVKPVDDYFKNLKANSHTFNGITGFDKENGTITSGGNFTKEITTERVAEAAREFVPSFLNSQEGADFTRMMLSKGVQSQAELNQAAYEHINHYGKINVFKESGVNNDLDVDWVTIRDKKLKETEDVYAPYVNGAVNDNPNAVTPDESWGGIILKSIKGFASSIINPEGSEAVQKKVKELGLVREGAYPHTYSKKGEKISAVEYDKQVDQVMKEESDKLNGDTMRILNDSYNRLKSTDTPINLDVRGIGKNKAEYEELYKTAIKNAQKVTLSGRQIGEDQAKLYGDLLNRAGASQLYNVQGYEKTVTLNEIAKEEGVDIKDITIHPNLIHYENLDRERPGGGVEVSIKAGEKVIPAFTPLNDNFTQSTSSISHIGQNSLYQGYDTYTKENPYKIIDHGDGYKAYAYTYTVPKKNYGNGYPFETIVVVEEKDRNGKTVDRDELSYSEFKANMSERADIQLQKVIGSGKSLNHSDAKSFYTR